MNKVLHTAVKGFSKEKKYTLGEDILSKNWQCLDLVIAANTLQGKERAKRIIKLSIVFDSLKVRLRMAEDIGVISLKQYTQINKQYIDPTGSMIGGWVKWAQEKIQ